MVNASEVSGMRRQNTSSLKHVGSAVRLTFVSDPLVGRQAEQQILYDLWERVANDRSHFFFVHGDTGVGKTALIENMAVSNKIVARFEPTQLHSRPYGAILDALNELCLVLSRRDDSEEIGEIIADSLVDELDMLVSILPKLERVVQCQPLNSNSSAGGRRRRRSSGISNSDKAKTPHFHRIKYLLLHFFRAVCNKLKSVMFFVDDLQNTDAFSVELIKMIFEDCTSARLNGLLLVGAYRPEELHKNHALELLFVELNAVSEKGWVSEMRLEATSAEHINDMLSKMMQMSPDETLELSRVIMKKTGGNMLAAQQLLEVGQELELITYSVSTYKWIWNIPELCARTDVSDNIVHVIFVRMGRLPRVHQHILSIAASLGTHFDPVIIDSVLRKMFHGTNAESDEADHNDECFRIQDSDSVIEIFDQLTGMGLVDSGPDGWSKFPHGRIHQAASALIPEGKARQELSLRIGEAMYSMRQDYIYDQSRYEWIFHACVDQLNLGSDLMKGDLERIDLARMNLEAAEKAKSKTAFVPAGEYADKGASLLEGVSKWGTNYELALALTSLAAEMHQLCGKFDRCMEKVSDILLHGKKLEDRLPAYFVKIEVLGAQRRLKESLVEACSTLTKLGVRMPRKPSLVSVGLNILATKRLLDGKSDTDFLSLSPMKDEIQVAVMRTMTKSKAHAFFAQDKKMLLMLYCRCAQYTLKHGLCKYSPSAFTDYGVLCASLGKHDEGYRYGKIGMELLKGTGSRDVISKVYVAYYLHLHHWRNPLHLSLDPLLRAHRLGLSEGDIQYGLLAGGIYCSHYFSAGFSLPHLVKDMSRFVTLMSEYQQETIAGIFRPLLQFLLNLSGKAKDPFKLTGTAMDEEMLLKQNLLHGNTTGARTIWVCLLQLGFFFRNLELTEKAILQARKIKVGVQPHFGFCLEVFIEGLAWFALAKAKGKSVYMRRGKLCLRRVRDWTTDGALNCHHLLLIMEAEWLTSKKNTTIDEVRESFDVAIAAAGRSGFQQNEAIACECAGMFCSERSSRVSSATALELDQWRHTYLSRAHRRYSGWGAYAKTKLLVEQYPFLEEEVSRANRRDSSKYSVDSSLSHGSNLRARTRFSSRHTDLHKALQYF